MSTRQIVLDTETTGLRVEDGHRVIEIGCVELIDRKFTGKQLQYYINPEREVEAGALAVHGITNEFLRDKPVFTSIVDEWMNFINGAELIIHNAPFDLGFLDYELMLTRQQWKPLKDYCNILDTLQLARRLHVGQRNSLDALCKRYGIDNSKRDMHGALLDAHLLAHVYLTMTGGQGSFFDSSNTNNSTTTRQQESVTAQTLDGHKLIVQKSTEEERAEHRNYLALLKKKGKCLWVDE